MTTSYVVCPSCGSLVGVRDDKCYSCGRSNPGLWGYGPLVRNPVRLVQPVQITPFHNVPESRRVPIIQSAPAVTHPVGQPVRSAPSGQSTRWHFPPAVQSVPAMQQQQPMRAAPPAHVAAPWQRASIAQSAPIARSMPAPQLRATERPFSRGFQAAGGGGNRGGNGGGGGGARGNAGRHRS